MICIIVFPAKEPDAWMSSDSGINGMWWTAAKPKQSWWMSVSKGSILSQWWWSTFTLIDAINIWRSLHNIWIDHKQYNLAIFIWFSTKRRIKHYQNLASKLVGYGDLQKGNGLCFKPVNIIQSQVLVLLPTSWIWKLRRILKQNKKTE